VITKDIRKQGLKALKYLQDIDKDDVLEAIGLEERSSAWSTAFGTIGIFALGCLVGPASGWPSRPSRARSSATSWASACAARRTS